MRLLLVTLAVLSLVVRWADSPCGCVAHNGWAAWAAEVADGHGSGHGGGGHGHDPSTPAHDPAFEHGCEGECGRAVYSSADRVPRPIDVAAMPPASLSDASDRVATASPDAVLASVRVGPARAMLKVYRI